MRGVQRSRISGRSISTSRFSPMELEIFTRSIPMLVFPSEVALEMSLRLERRVGPIAEICEAVSPTFSLSLSEPRLGQQILISERIGARPETRGIVLQIQNREKTKTKRTTEI